MIIDLLI